MLNHSSGAALMMSLCRRGNSGSAYSDLIELTLNSCSETENSEFLNSEFVDSELVFLIVCWVCWTSFLKQAPDHQDTVCPQLMPFVLLLCIVSWYFLPVWDFMRKLVIQAVFQPCFRFFPCCCTSCFCLKCSNLLLLDSGVSLLDLYILYDGLCGMGYL